MYKKIGMLICALSICTTVLPSSAKISAEEEKKRLALVPQGPARFFAIFLNESEFRGKQEFDVARNTTISAELSKALIAKSFPILVSASLFTAVVTKNDWFENKWKRERDVAAGDTNKVFTNLWQSLSKTKKHSSLDFLRDLLVEEQKKVYANTEYVQQGITEDLRNLFYYRTLYDSDWQTLGITPLFNFDDWEIRGLEYPVFGDILYLLVPKTYLDNLGCAVQRRPLLPETSTITPCEERLGIKIDHMSIVTWKNIQQIFINRKQPATQQEQDQRNLMALSALYGAETLENYVFVPQDFYTKRQSDAPAWVVYATGHGSRGDQIMSLNIKAFIHLLDACARINTKALFINSCFAGGQNITTIMNIAMSEAAKKRQARVQGNPYPFYIIVQSIDETETFLPFDTIDFTSLGANDIDFVTKTFKVLRIKGREFGEVVKELQKTGPLDFMALQKLLFPSVGNRKISEISQIFAPGETSKILKEGFFNISEEFVLGRTAKLVFPDRALIPDLKGLAFNTNVFFDIEINTTNPIDILVTEGYIFIKKISTTKAWGIEGILQSFIKTALTSTLTDRVVVIDEIGDGNKTCKNVVIALNYSLDRDEKQPGQCSMYVTCGGKLQVVRDCRAANLSFRDPTRDEREEYSKANSTIVFLQSEQKDAAQKKEQQAQSTQLMKTFSEFNAQLGALTRVVQGA